MIQTYLYLEQLLMSQAILKKEIKEFCELLELQFSLIPEERKAHLRKLSDYIATTIKKEATPQLIVICTHNSRRSHMGQLWLAVGADYYELPTMATFSGGTEATAFNPRAVQAFQRIGFDIRSKDTDISNPIYAIQWAIAQPKYIAFSKKYDTAPNPTEKFGAIMVCTSADEGCPVITGCEFRFSLPFEDPKAFDDTELEATKYDERCRQIGREILYALSKVAEVV